MTPFLLSKGFALRIRITSTVCYFAVVQQNNWLHFKKKIYYKAVTVYATTQSGIWAQDDVLLIYANSCKSPVSLSSCVIQSETFYFKFGLIQVHSIENSFTTFWLVGTFISYTYTQHTTGLPRYIKGIKTINQPAETHLSLFHSFPELNTVNIPG